MKNESPDINHRTGLAIVFVLLVLTSCQQVDTGRIAATLPTSNTIVFEGTLEKLGSDPGTVSGIDLVYRLAKYRVDRVCEGKYEGTEIVVDHIVFDMKQFQDIDINDRVCVSVEVTKDILVRYNAEGIRNPWDDVKIFYIAADKFNKVNPGQTCCYR